MTRIRHTGAIALLTSLFAPISATAQEPSPTTAPAPAVPSAPARPPVPSPTPAAEIPSVPPPAPGFVRIPALTLVSIEIVDPLTSKTAVIDAPFAIRLAEPIRVDGVVAVPAGVVGEGQIVHAAKARALGKAGELILAARFLKCGDVRIPLRSFHFGDAGQDKSRIIAGAVAVGGALATPFMFMSGGEMIVPTGARAGAKLSATTDVSPTACTAGAPQRSM